jgi:hypothetical protein
MAVKSLSVQTKVKAQSWLGKNLCHGGQLAFFVK